MDACVSLTADIASFFLRTSDCAVSWLEHRMLPPSLPLTCIDLHCPSMQRRLEEERERDQREREEFEERLRARDEASTKVRACMLLCGHASENQIIPMWRIQFNAHNLVVEPAIILQAGARAPLLYQRPQEGELI